MARAGTEGAPSRSPCSLHLCPTEHDSPEAASRLETGSGRVGWSVPPEWAASQGTAAAPAPSRSTKGHHHRPHATIPVIPSPTGGHVGTLAARLSVQCGAQTGSVPAVRGRLRDLGQHRPPAGCPRPDGHRVDSELRGLRLRPPRLLRSDPQKACSLVLSGPPPPRAMSTASPNRPAAPRTWPPVPDLRKRGSESRTRSPAGGASEDGLRQERRGGGRSGSRWLCALCPREPSGASWMPLRRQVRLTGASLLLVSPSLAPMCCLALPDALCSHPTLQTSAPTWPARQKQLIK